jgi:hypothetical protein
VGTQLRQQKPMGGNPTDGLQHAQGPGDEVGSGHRGGQRRQGRAQGSGLPLKTTDPKLAALVRHAGLGSGSGGSLQRAAIPQTSDEKQGDHQNTEPEIG